ncbi:ABC transporter substrate-binding protein [Candidatus Pelagibacter sp.]|nr:ABC transporter substrate-binding protein [Candidatus Pelagibacter sp.]
MERIITKSFARLMGRGTHRGFITYEELNKSLGKRNLSDENLSQAFIHILDEGVALVEKKSDFKVLRKKEGSSKEEGKAMEKSDDPIRMYLREMGGVELLSREGEIAIAKRIEAGKDVMLIALSQSPMTAQQFYDWNNQLQKDEILVREIIDIDTNYMEDESTGPSAKQKNAGETDKDDNSGDGDDDDFNPTLAEYSNPEIKVISKKKINKNYTIVLSKLVATESRPEVKIEWRVYTKNLNNLLIRDLIIEGLSLARTQKEEFNSIINSNDGNIEVLLENLTNFSSK